MWNQFYNRAGDDVTPQPLLANDQKSQLAAAFFSADNASDTVRQSLTTLVIVNSTMQLLCFFALLRSCLQMNFCVISRKTIIKILYMIFISVSGSKSVVHVATLSK